MTQIITRDAAQLAGLKRFYTGKLCSRGHDAERFVSSGGCIDCVNRRTPRKLASATARNRVFPLAPLSFDPALNATREEMEAAYLAIETFGWHNAAIVALRKDPELMLRLMPKPTIAQQQAVAQELERMQRVLEAHANVK